MHAARLGPSTKNGFPWEMSLGTLPRRRRLDFLIIGWADECNAGAL